MKNLNKNILRQIFGFGLITNKTKTIIENFALISLNQCPKSHLIARLKLCYELWFFQMFFKIY